MVQTIPQPLETWTEPVQIPTLLDPAIAQAARWLYQDYCRIHRDRYQRPLGIVVNRRSWRTVLIFKRIPAVLPQEYFVPLEQIESGLY